MPRMTTQAMALNDAYRASGAPTSHPRRQYQARADKAYSVKTDKRYYTSEVDHQRYYEYGDAVLHADNMPYDEAVRVAEYIASVGFHAVVFPHAGGDPTAGVMATTEYAERGRVTVYDRTYRWQDMKQYRVEPDADRHAAAWKRANEV